MDVEGRLAVGNRLNDALFRRQNVSATTCLAAYNAVLFRHCYTARRMKQKLMLESS